MSFAQTMGEAIVSPLGVMGRGFLQVIPKVVIAGIIIIFGYLLGLLLGFLVTHALRRMKFSEKVKKLHIAKPLEKIRLAAVTGWVVKWYTFLAFVSAGLLYINIQPVAGLIQMALTWFPKLLLAGAIFVLGLMGAEYLHHLLGHVHMKEAGLLASIAKFFVIIVVLVLALKQVIDVSILENIVIVLVAGLSLGAAVAVGIAFGLALKEDARAWIETFKNK